jgi:hypothetical protein
MEEERKKYFETADENPFSLFYFNNKYIYEDHSPDELIQRGIICIYTYLKYVIRHFDNGYGNFGYHVKLDREIDLSETPKKYKNYMNFLKSEELFSFEFLIFSLGLMLRNKDPKEDNEYIDTEFPHTHSYPSYRLLVLAHQKKIEKITFEDAKNIIITDTPYYYNEKTNMSEREYFDITYKVLVKSLL